MKGLDWTNERFVRSPTRDTPAWMVLGWATQNLWLQLQRKMDRAGVIPLDPDLMPYESIAAMLPQAPPEEVEVALGKLISKGWLVHDREADVLLDPEFLEREEAPMSDRQRQHESRRRRRDHHNLSQNVTSASQNVTETSHGVTARHTVSHGVTPSVPTLPVPTLPKKKAAAPRAGSRVEQLQFPESLVEAVPDIRELWLESREDRRLSKRTTASAENKQLVKLAEWAERYGAKTVRDEIERANRSGWQGICFKDPPGANEKPEPATVIGGVRYEEYVPVGSR